MGPGAGKPLLLGSLSALLLAYLVRFIAVAYGPLENSLARIRPSLPEADRYRPLRQALTDLNGDGSLEWVVAKPWRAENQGMVQ